MSFYRYLSSIQSKSKNIDQSMNLMVSGTYEMIKENKKNANLIEAALNNNMNAVSSFHQDFNMLMGDVSIKIDMQRKEFIAGINNIATILRNRRKTDAFEDFQDAINFYNDGLRFPDKTIWMDNAHKYFNASIKKYERNPAAHLYLAHIYHYNSRYRDFDKALYHYELCYTYGEANRENYALAAQGYMYAGWIHAAIKNDIDKGINLTERAVYLDKSLSSAVYNLIVLNNLKGDRNSAVEYIEQISKYGNGFLEKILEDDELEDLFEYAEKIKYENIKKVQDRYNNILNECKKVIVSCKAKKYKFVDCNGLESYAILVERAVEESLKAYMIDGNIDRSKDDRIGYVYENFMKIFHMLDKDEEEAKKEDKNIRKQIADSKINRDNLLYKIDDGIKMIDETLDRIDNIIEENKIEEEERKREAEYKKEQEEKKERKDRFKMLLWIFILCSVAYGILVIVHDAEMEYNNPHTIPHR